jgi:hypothetical protein
MTDTRLPEHYLTSPALEGLTDSAFRVFINGLMFSVTHGTDGKLAVRSLRWLHPDVPALEPAAAELTAAGLWRRTENGWSIVDFLKWQTPAADVEAGRAKARDNRRRQRKHYRGDHSECTPETCGVVRMSGATVPSVAPRPLRTEDRTQLRVTS